MRIAPWLPLALVGCTSATGGDIFQSDPTPYADLYTDGSRLDVVGCPAAAILGCSPYAPTTSDRMQITIDGNVLAVPVAPADLPPIDDRLAGLLHGGPFGMTTTVPSDGRVGIALDSAGSTVTLPTPPAIAAPAHVSRSQGTLTVRYDLVTDPQTVVMFVKTSCAGVSGSEMADAHETGPGEIAVDLTRFIPVNATTCTYEVHVDQTIELAELPALPTRAIAISIATISSDP